MTLVDTLVSGVIFGLASFASLQIHASSLRVSGGLQQRRERDAAMDLLLAQVHRALDRAAQELTADAALPSCDTSAAALQQSLIAVLPAAAPGGVTLQLGLEGDLLSATAQAPELPLRRRWYSPAAYGLCGNPADTPPS